MVQFTVIAILTAIPASLFMWIVHKLRLEFLVIFAGFGAALGWCGNLIQTGSDAAPVEPPLLTHPGSQAICVFARLSGRTGHHSAGAS
ncbi:hypothetical protein XH86_28725 [Bradyrhizobium guangdongense]|uniref:Uncharacterized protein n=1 Tax=Bradyrhizobium guangdongense TaxID=1325090 RepID=A0ABX6ULQ5_9BRAD|nr:hypothetical protein X265_28690 [Bradyrhizobium guangdongense]QOZ62280.1 hypothetical protein XH86_28725 [Bradyrhizobium guangdongense]